MGSGGTGAGGGGPGVGGGSYAGGEGWGPTMGGGSGYGGDLGGLGTAGTMSGGAGGAGMSGYGGGGQAGMAGSGWGGGGGLAGRNAAAAPGTVGYTQTTVGPGQPKLAAAPGWHAVTTQGQYRPGEGPTFTTSYVKDTPAYTAANTPGSTNYAGTEGWGPTMGGGSGYGGDLGGLGTAGTMSGGAGGAGMSGYGGGGQAGISGSGWGGPGGSAGPQGGGGAAANRAAAVSGTRPPGQTFSQALPTQTSALLTPKSMFGVMGPPPNAPGFLGQPYGINPSQVNPGFGYSPGTKTPFGTGGRLTSQGYQGVNPGLRDRMGGNNTPSPNKGPQGYSGGAYGNTRGPVGGRRM